MITSAKPLRVCHVAYSFYESDNRVIRYAETLARRGDHVDVLALRRAGQPGRVSLNGVVVDGVQTRTRNEKAAWAYLLKILLFFVKSFTVLSVRSLRHPYDVVHVHNIPDFLVFVTLVAKLRGARVILDVHDVVPELYAGKFGTASTSALFRSLLFIERLSCTYADHVIVANHLWLEKVQARSARPGHCTALLNYPDMALFSARKQPYAATRSPFVFLYPGTLNHHQGIDIAIDAFAKAREAMPGAELHIYGDGPTRPALREQARSAGLVDCVKFMERVTLAEVPAILATAHVGLVPKRADGFGNEAFSTKILEFMASGVPTIVSRTRIDAHYFDETVVRFFAPGDASDLAREMRWAYDHPSELNELASTARRVAEAYSWQRHAGEYVGIVTALIPAIDPSLADERCKPRATR